jgi:hypothetical protein
VNYLRLIGIEPMTSSMPFLAASVNRCVFTALVAPKAPKTPLERVPVPLLSQIWHIVPALVYCL